MALFLPVAAFVGCAGRPSSVPALPVGGVAEVASNFVAQVKTPGLAAGTGAKATRASGTAFLVYGSDFRLYLVTTPHVAWSTTAETSVIFLGPDSRQQSFTLGTLTASPTWIYHPHEDVAVLKLSPRGDVHSKLVLHAIREEQVTPDPHYAPSSGATLVILGFPVAETAGAFRPMPFDARTAKEVSSGYKIEKVDGSSYEVHFLLLSQPSLEGFSGAPVFEVAGNEIKYCVGVLHGTQVIENFAAVAPAGYVLEVIKSLR